MKFLRYFFFILFIFSFSTSIADDRVSDLHKLFNKLKINNATLVYKTEQKIWELWSTHPTDQFLTQRLAEGSRLVINNKLDEAINIFTEVIKKDPTWAEAWNKRATVFYMLGNYKSSQNDIDKVLNLEKRHFGALAGQGLVNIELENYEKAIESYKKAQEIYPTMQSSQIMINKLNKLIDKLSI